MRNLKRNTGIAGAAAILAALGMGGAYTAQASAHTPAPVVQPTDATGVEGAEAADDGPDQGPDANPDQPGHQDTNQGPDANPNEAGHQDADESGETK